MTVTASAMVVQARTRPYPESCAWLEPEAAINTDCLARDIARRLS